MTEEPGGESGLDRVARRWSLAASAGVALLALAVLLGGWVAGSSLFIRIQPGLSAMVPSTAVGLLILAAALIAHDRRGKIAPGSSSVMLRLVSVVVAAVSLINLAVIGTGAAGGIDALLWPAIDDPHSGQSPATSICFLLAAVSMYRLSAARPDGDDSNEDLIFTAAATTGFLFSLIAVVGYLFDAEALYAVSIFTAMALHTAVGFVAVFGALLLRNPHLGWIGLLLGPGSGSAGARRVFPIMVVGSFVLCLLAYHATEARIFSANFRLSLLAILIMALLIGTVLRNAAIENRAERELRSAMAELRESLASRELLLRELNHRVKNNLQQITAMIWFQSASLSDTAAKDAFLDTIGRIQTLSTVHRLLLPGPNPSEMVTDGFFEELCENIASAYSTGERQIDIGVDIANTRLHIDDAITLGLLVNELVTNAVKHAFPSGGGKITVGFSKERDGTTVLKVADNGMGQPGEKGPDGPDRGVGMQIVDGLVAQLHATIVWNWENGTTVTVTVPKVHETVASHA